MPCSLILPNDSVIYRRGTTRFILVMFVLRSLLRLFIFLLCHSKGSEFFLFLISLMLENIVQKTQFFTVFLHKHFSLPQENVLLYFYKHKL